MKDGTTIFIFVILGAIVIGVIIYAIFFNRAAVVKRALRKTPPKEMRDVLSGDIVRLKGNIDLCGKVLIAPLSGRKCAYYHVEILQHKSSGKNSRWVTILNDEQAGDIVIRDGRHHAIIPSTGAKCFLVQDHNKHSGFMNDASPELNAYLQSKGIKSVSWIGLNKSLKYREGILEANEVITAAGKANWISKSQVNFDIPSDRILMLEPHEKDCVYFTDATIA